MYLAVITLISAIAWLQIQNINITGFLLLQNIKKFIVILHESPIIMLLIKDFVQTQKEFMEFEYEKI